MIRRHPSSKRNDTPLPATTPFRPVIDTNSVRTTRIDAPANKRGKVDVRRAQLEKTFSARRYGPDKVAKAIVSAVKKNKPIRPVAPEAYIVYGVAHLLQIGRAHV